MKKKKKKWPSYDGGNEILGAGVGIPLNIWDLPLAGMIQHRGGLIWILKIHQLKQDLVSLSSIKAPEISHLELQQKTRTTKKGGRSKGPYDARAAVEPFG